MKELAIVNGIKNMSKTAWFKTKKHSPEILLVAGIAGIVVATVEACRATTKVDDIIEESKMKIATVHEALEKPEYVETGKYTEEDSKKDLTTIYIQTGAKVARAYAPAFILGSLSIVSILSSHGILKQRNAAIAAAYATVDKGFKEYRERVVEQYGDKVDRNLKHGIRAEKLERTEVDANGKEKKVKEDIEVADEIHETSEYARFFDEACSAWEKNSEFNLAFLRAQQQYANDRLIADGYLFLNDVYDSLGIPRTKAGQIVGWVYDRKNPKGDNFVDFGIYDLYRERNRAFVNGYERSILLDFNVDGNILDLM